MKEVYLEELIRRKAPYIVMDVVLVLVMVSGVVISYEVRVCRRCLQKKYNSYPFSVDTQTTPFAVGRGRFG